METTTETTALEAHAAIDFHGATPAAVADWHFELAQLILAAPDGDPGLDDVGTPAYVGAAIDFHGATPAAVADWHFELAQLILAAPDGDPGLDDVGTPADWFAAADEAEDPHPPAYVGAALTARLEAGVDPTDWDTWAPATDRVNLAADRCIAASGWGTRPIKERMAAKRRLLDHFARAVR